MGCKDKIKYTCSGSRIFAVCTEYQGEIPEFSYLTIGCLSVEEVLDDHYKILSDIKENIDLSSLTNDCIVFTEPKTVKSVISQLYDKICELKTREEEQDVIIEDLLDRVEALETNNCP